MQEGSSAASALLHLSMPRDSARIEAPEGFKMSDVALNAQLLQHGGVFIACCSTPICVLRCSETTGVVELQLPESAVGQCRQLAQYMCDSSHRSQRGFLLIGDIEYPGFTKYRSVPVDEAAFNGTIQQQFTTMVKGSWIKRAMVDLPMLRFIVKSVLEKLDMCMEQVKQIHLLHQGNPHATFLWHHDGHDLKLSRRSMTIVVALNDCVSGMQVCGFEPVYYSNCGHAFAFPGSVLHRTLPPPLSETRNAASYTYADALHLQNGEVWTNSPLKLSIFCD